jgi:hypothetical protein
MTDKQAAAAAWLKEQGILDSISEFEHKALLSLIGNEAFGFFWALMMRDRAIAATQLSNVNLGDGRAVAMASVLQGQIRAIDAIHGLMLNIADPSADDPQAQQQEEQ